MGLTWKLWNFKNSKTQAEDRHHGIRVFWWSLRDSVKAFQAWSISTSRIMMRFSILSTQPVFPNLESLFLEILMNPETFCDGLLARGSLRKLRVLEVRNCQKLEPMVMVGSEDKNEVVEINQLYALKVNDILNLI